MIQFNQGDKITLHLDNGRNEIEYTYLELLGTKATGQAKLCKVCDKTGDEYALKIVLPITPEQIANGLSQNELNYRLKNEAEILSKINNSETEHIIKCHHYGYIDYKNIKYPTLCLSLKEGDLTKYSVYYKNIQAYKFTMQDATKWLVQIIHAVYYLHSQRIDGKPISHRDIKLENILYDNNKNVFLSDLGIIKEITSSTTCSNQGTRSLQAPEQILPIYIKTVKNGKGEDKEVNVNCANIEVDIYALGLTFYILLVSETTKAQSSLEFDNNNFNKNFLEQINYISKNRNEFPNIETSPRPIGKLGIIGGLTTEEINLFKKKLITAIDNDRQQFTSPANSLPNYNKWVNDFVRIIETMLAPWQGNRPTAKQVKEQAQRLAAEFSPTVDAMKIVAKDNFNCGGEISLELTIDGMGLPCSDLSWLIFKLNGRDYAQATVSLLADKSDYSNLCLAERSTIEKPVTQLNSNTSFANKHSYQQVKLKIILAAIDKVGSYNFTAAINYYSIEEETFLLSEHSFIFNIEASAEQLWQSGDHYAALAKEQRAEWLNQLLINLKTVQEAIKYYDFTVQHLLPEQQNKCLALKIWNENEQNYLIKPYQIENVAIKKDLALSQSRENELKANLTLVQSSENDFKSKLVVSETKLKNLNTEKSNLQAQLNNEKSKQQVAVNNENKLRADINKLQSELAIAHNNSFSITSLVIPLFLLALFAGVINIWWYQPSEKLAGAFACKLIKCQTASTPLPTSDAQPPWQTTSAPSQPVSFATLVAEADKLVVSAREENHSQLIPRALKGYADALRQHGAKLTKEQLQQLFDNINSALSKQFSFNNPQIKQKLNFTVFSSYPYQVISQPSQENIEKYLQRFNQFSKLGVIDTSKLIDSRFLASAKGDEITDITTGLTWARCSVGQSWDGSSCTGKAERFTFAEAQKLSKDGWRVPTVRELFSLVDCSSRQIGQYTNDDPQDGGGKIINGCQGNYLSPTINAHAFPNTTPAWFWTSTISGDSSDAWNVNFGYGYVGGYQRSSSFLVRLVR